MDRNHLSKQDPPAERAMAQRVVGGGGEQILAGRTPILIGSVATAVFRVKCNQRKACSPCREIYSAARLFLPRLFMRRTSSLFSTDGANIVCKSVSICRVSEHFPICRLKPSTSHARCTEMLMTNRGTMQNYFGATSIRCECVNGLSRRSP